MIKTSVKNLLLLFVNISFFGCSLLESSDEEPIEIDFEITLSNTDSPAVVSIENKTAGASNFNWSFSNGTPSGSVDQTPPNVEYLEGGVYEVRLEASNDSETKTLTKTFFLGPVENGLVAYYPFSENANDQSRFDNHGTVSGATLTADRDGNSNSAYSFDGVDDFIEVPAADNLSATDYELSISIWIKVIDFSEGNLDGTFFIDKAMNNGESTDWGITYNDRWVEPFERRFMGRLFIPGGPNTGGTNTVIGFHSETLPELDQWYHLVLNYDLRGTAGEEIFINGTSGSFVGNGGNEEMFTENTASLFIGREGNGNSYFNGTIDDIRIFNRTLDSLEVNYLFNSSN